MRPCPVFDWRTSKTPRSKVAVCVLPPSSAVVSATWPLRVSMIAPVGTSPFAPPRATKPAAPGTFTRTVPSTGATRTEVPSTATGAAAGSVAGAVGVGIGGVTGAGGTGAGADVKVWSAPKAVSNDAARVERDEAEVIEGRRHEAGRGRGDRAGLIAVERRPRRLGAVPRRRPVLEEGDGVAAARLYEAVQGRRRVRDGGRCAGGRLRAVEVGGGAPGQQRRDEDRDRGEGR